LDTVVMQPDFNAAHVLLPFVEGALAQGCRVRAVHASLGIDGSMIFAIDDGDEALEVRWEECPAGIAGEAPFAYGVVRCASPGLDPAREARMCTRVARCLQRLHAGVPPDLLLFRNRNLREVSFGSGLFDRLARNVMKAGKTRYFSYLLGRVTEYGGHVNLEFTSADADVVVRLMPHAEPAGAARPVATCGPLDLVLVDDTRTAEKREKREHRVEDFVGYVLRRNAPGDLALRFERDDPPPGHLPPDLYVDFLGSSEVDDSTVFQMLFAGSGDIAVVASCDRECLNFFSFVAAPVEEWTQTAPWRVHPRPTLLARLHHVSLSEQALVMGEDRLGSCLAAVRGSCPAPRLAVFVDSCVNRLIGQDCNGALDEAARMPGPPVVAYPQDLRQEPYLAGPREFLGRLYEAAADADVVVSHARVNLVGLGPDPTGEIARLLDACGVEVGARLMPQLDAQELAGFGRAALTVVSSWHYVGAL
jgi:hypothetical protein